MACQKPCGGFIQATGCVKFGPVPQQALRFANIRLGVADVACPERLIDGLGVLNSRQIDRQTVAYPIKQLIQRSTSPTGDIVYLIDCLGIFRGGGQDVRLNRIVDEAETLALERDALHGAYVVEFEPIEGLNSIRTTIIQAILDYLEKTKQANKTDLSIIWNQDNNSISISKTHDQKNYVTVLFFSV